jgi:hypothetical protein
MSKETKDTIVTICVFLGFVFCLYIGAIIG